MLNNAHIPTKKSIQNNTLLLFSDIFLVVIDKLAEYFQRVRIF